MNLDTIELIGYITTIAGLIGLGANTLWAQHLEARFEDEKDEENGL